MLGLIFAVALTLLSAAFVWLHKPQPETDWQGHSAAYFMVGLAGAGYGFMSLIAPEQQSTMSLMLEQLFLYAALPLLVAVEAANFFNRQWSRQIWGRVLLAIAATFELCRRNNVLDEMLWVTLALGTVALLATAMRKPRGLGWVQAAAWLAVSGLYFSNLVVLPSLAYGTLLLLAIFPLPAFARLIERE